MLVPYVGAAVVTVPIALIAYFQFGWGWDFGKVMIAYAIIQALDGNLLVPLLNILTPFPGTKLFKRFEKEQRILHQNWDKYDTKHVVFSPAGMSAEELLAGYRRILRQVYSFDSILKKLKHYWEIDFWQQSNSLDPVKLKYRFLFALRLSTLLFSFNLARSKFIIKILPRVFNRRVRISTLLTLMAYNDFAYSL